MTVSVSASDNCDQKPVCGSSWREGPPAVPDVRIAMRATRLRRSHRHGILAGQSVLLLFILPCRKVLTSFVLGSFKQARPGNDGCGQLEANSVRIEEVN